MSEQKEQRVKWWQREWTETTKGAITKAFLPKIEDRLKLRLTAIPNFTAIVTGHGNIKAYLQKYKIIDDQPCHCRKGPQTVEQERNPMAHGVTREGK